MAEQYQDVWVRGATLSKGVRECESRYEAIERAILTRFERPFTVLDLGAAQGYFGFRIADRFPACVVMAEADASLTGLCAQNRLPGTIHLSRQLAVEDLRELGRCEHFDVVLALNVLHHFEDFDGALEAVTGLGDHVVIETPSIEDTAAVNYDAIPALVNLIRQLPTFEIARTPSHTNETERSMVVLARHHGTLTVPYFHAPPIVRGAEIRVSSTYRDKYVWIPRKHERREWVHGINLQTYLSLDGAWPGRDHVARWIRTYRPEGHGDVRPWNFILDGDDVHLIDAGDERGLDEDDLPAVEATAAEVARA